jgi:hypothetical protein
MCDPKVTKNQGKGILGLALAIRFRRGALSAIVALWFVIGGTPLIAPPLIITGVLLDVQGTF